MRPINLAVAGVLASVCVVAATLPASAIDTTFPGDPVVGDIDDDGYPDRITLGDEGGVFTPPSTCSVEVEPGLPGGLFGPAMTATYDLGPGDFDYCADIGVVVDLGGDGTNELVLAFFVGSQLADADLLALRDFERVGGFSGQFQPSGIGLANFNGDARVDVWEVTDQGDGLTTFINTSSGNLVPGPAKLCNVQFPLFDIADVNGDGDDDIVGTSDCDGSTALVKVGGKTGKVTVLMTGLDSAESYGPLNLIDVDSDGDLDVTFGFSQGDTTFLHNGKGAFAPVPFINEKFASGPGGISRVSGGTFSQASSDIKLTSAASGAVGNSNTAVHSTLVGGNLTLKVRMSAAKSSSTSDDVSFLFYYTDPSDYWYVNLAERNSSSLSGVFHVSGGVATQVADISRTITADKMYAVQVDTSGSSTKVKLNDKTVATFGSGTDGLPQTWAIGLGSIDNNAKWDDLSAVRR